jgi:hypothetical protein
MVRVKRVLPYFTVIPITFWEFLGTSISGSSGSETVPNEWDSADARLFGASCAPTSATGHGGLSERWSHAQNRRLPHLYSTGTVLNTVKERKIIRRGSCMHMNAAGPHHTVHGITDLYKRYTQTTRTRKHQGGKSIQTVFIYFFFSLSLSLFTRVLVPLFQYACGGKVLHDSREGDEPKSSSHVTDLDLRLAAGGGRADHYNRRKQKPRTKKKKDT